MATTTGVLKVSRPRIEPAENGFVLTWDETKPPTGKKQEIYSSWDNTTTRTKVFKIDEKEKAMDELVDLSKQAGFEMEAGKEVRMPTKKEEES